MSSGLGIKRDGRCPGLILGEQEGMPRKQSPDMKELARMKVMSDMGMSDRGIGRALERSNHTIKKYLQMDVFFDPTIREMVEKIKEKELADLFLIGAKAKARIHQIFDEEPPALIPAVAALDRVFQQRRLLEGMSTQIIDYEAAEASSEALKRRLEALEEEARRFVKAKPIGSGKGEK